MDEREIDKIEKDVAFLFDISNEIKNMYETSVIYMEKKDYSEMYFNTVCDLRSALYEGSKNRIIDIIVDYHLQWLHNINELDEFKKRILRELPREEVYQAISYTIDSIGYRLKHYLVYMEKNRPTLTNTQQADVNADLEIVQEMHTEIATYLLEKLKCFRNYTSNQEFKIKLIDEVDELLLWIDNMNDRISFLLSKYLPNKILYLTGDLTKTLQKIVDEIISTQSETGQEILEELKNKSKENSTLVCYTATHRLEIAKIEDKIHNLEDRIKHLNIKPISPALMALQYEKKYFEKRLSFLENLKTTLKSIRAQNKAQDDIDEEEVCSCKEFYQLRIFNHSLPPKGRERLVTELCSIWDLAIFGEPRHKSIISILSAADTKEQGMDELGTFYIDEHSRKIYKMKGDTNLYQPNEHNVLVPVTDDSEHIYFYDECGRYYVETNTRQRIYKAHATASEYTMDSSGILLKYKELRDGIEYHYDHFGRYYFNADGKQIYREEDRISEYENDGLGNLVRIRSHIDIFEPCPDDTNVTEDFEYLKENVGSALRQGIANCIMFQPADPIEFLSLQLLKYQKNLESREKMSREKEALDVEREIRIAEERDRADRAALESSLLDQGGSEASYDSNLMKYTSAFNEDEQISFDNRMK